MDFDRGDFYGGRRGTGGGGAYTGPGTEVPDKPTISDKPIGREKKKKPKK